MNVNELADGIENCTTDLLHKKVATMLRDQQAEIEVLKQIIRGLEAIGEERGNKALRNNEIGKILTKVLDDCGLLKKASEK